MENKNIRMRFPYDTTGSNSLLDGNIHSITPSRLCRIGNSNLFVLDYFDNVASAHCTTFLAFINGYLTKVPVDNYGLAFEMLNRLNCHLHPVSLDMLPSFIDCTDIKSPAEVFSIEFMYHSGEVVQTTQSAPRAVAMSPAGPPPPPPTPPIPPRTPVSPNAVRGGNVPPTDPPKPKQEPIKPIKPVKHLYIPFYGNSFGSVFEGLSKFESERGVFYGFANCDEKFANLAKFNESGKYSLDKDREFTFESNFIEYVVHYVSTRNPELPNLSHQASSISILSKDEKPMLSREMIHDIQYHDASAEFALGCMEAFPIALYPKSKGSVHFLDPFYVGGVEEKHSGRR